MFLELFVFRHRQFRTEEKIPDGVFVEDPVHQDALLAPLEVDPVIVGPITVESCCLAFDYTQTHRIQAVPDGG
jgi:hypothetical protein